MSNMSWLNVGKSFKNSNTTMQTESQNKPLIAQNQNKDNSKNVNETITTDKSQNLNKRMTAADFISDSQSSDDEKISKNQPISGKYSAHKNSILQPGNDKAQQQISKREAKAESKKRKDKKRLLKQAVKERILQDTLQNPLIAYENIKPQNLDIERDESMINSALQLLAKHDQVPDYNFHKPSDNKVQLKDFQKIQLQKSKIPGISDYLSISLNRVRNKEIYEYGGFMDKDIPIYTRVRRCKIVLGLEHEKKLSAQLLIDMNERLGEYDNYTLKKIVEGKRRKEDNIRFYDRKFNRLNDDDQIIKIMSSELKRQQTMNDLKMGIEFLGHNEQLKNKQLSKVEDQKQQDRQDIEDYLSGNLKINYDEKNQSSQQRNVQEKASFLLSKVRDQPKDINSWLDLVETQNHIYFLKSMQRQEKQLSILENLSDYETFCDQEYPKFGDMLSMNGYIDYMNLKQQKGPNGLGREDLILIKAREDFIFEEFKDQQSQLKNVSQKQDSSQLKQWCENEKNTYFNLRPRKTYFDEEYIQINTEIQTGRIWKDQQKYFKNIQDLILNNNLQINAIVQKIKLNREIQISLNFYHAIVILNKKIKISGTYTNNQFEILHFIYANHLMLKIDKLQPIIYCSNLTNDKDRVLDSNEIFKKESQPTQLQILGSLNDFIKFYHTELQKKFMKQTGRTPIAQILDKLYLELCLKYTSNIQRTFQVNQLIEKITSQNLEFQMENASIGLKCLKPRLMVKLKEPSLFSNNGGNTKIVKTQSITTQAQLAKNSLVSTYDPKVFIPKLHDYLVIYINNFSFNKETFIDYFSMIDELKQFKKEDELNKEVLSIRDLYIQKGLRLNQSGVIDDIPIDQQ
eukprot:403370771